MRKPLKSSMAMLIFITAIALIVPLTHAAVDQHFALHSNSVPFHEQRTLNIAVWAGYYNVEVETLPALLYAMARVKNESLLPEYVNVNLHIVPTCGANDQPGLKEDYKAIAQLHEDMVYYNGVLHGIIGPFSTICESIVLRNGGLGLFHAAQLLAHYNIPVMPHAAVGSQVAENLKNKDFVNTRELFPTLSRVAYTSTSMAKGLYEFVKSNRWTQVGIICGDNENGITYYACQATNELFEVYGLKVNHFAVMNETASTSEIDFILEETMRKARIIIAPMKSACVGAELALLKRASALGMLTGDFVFVTAHTNGIAVEEDATSWCPDDSLTNMYKQPHIFKVTFKGMTREDLRHGQRVMRPYGRKYDLDSIVWDINIANALYTMLDATGHLLNDLGWSHVHNGSLVQDYSIMNPSKGIHSPIILDKNGDRMGEFSVQIKRREGIVKVMTIDLHNDTSGEYHDLMLVPTVLHELFLNGVPFDEPECFFDGSACDMTNETLLLVGFVLLALLIPICYWYHRRRQRQHLMSMTWRINFDNLHLVNEGVKPRCSLSKWSSRLSMFSIKDGQLLHMNFGEPIKKMSERTIVDENEPSIETQEALLFGVRCQARHYLQLRSVERLADKNLQAIEQIRRVTTDNLNAFMGIAFNQYDRITIVWKYEARCTLYDVIGNTDFSLTDEFKASFVKDIVNGMNYLHETANICHGQLNLHSCVVTPQWTVRISNYGLANVLDDEATRKNIRMPRKTLHETLHLAPEILNGLVVASYQGDVYSLGVVVYQVFNKIFVQHLVDDLQHVSLREQKLSTCTSSIPSTSAISITASIDWSFVCWNVDFDTNILKQCMSNTPSTRPSINIVRKNLANASKKILRNGGIVDHMMNMMETYTKDLERLVCERTASLEEAQKQADRLLNQLLPPSVSVALKKGNVVEPEMYASATIGFVDVVQFTNFCTHSTPFQIVTFLNELFSKFDANVSRYKAYKVETIGDAYMIVSGIPLRNGGRHAHDICAAICEMLDVGSRVEVPHMPVDYRITLRGGVHTGPTAAGVVGSHAPRYCLFGDSVNTASRMESTGVPNKVQISNDTHECLRQWGEEEFDMQLRGEVQVKGKGLMKTYFVKKKTTLIEPSN